MKSFDFNEIVKRKSQQTPANASKECQQRMSANENSKNDFSFFSPVLSCCCLRPSYIYRDYFLVCSQAK